MKRELKLNFGELRLVEKRVTEFQDALADIDEAAAYFDEVLGEQESEAVEVLMERHREMEEEIRYFQDILSQLETLLENYISDMESYIMPKDENRMMLVDRNDIWWNMKQIGANLVFARNVASGRELGYYSSIDTTPSPPHIYEEMSPEAQSAAWDRYRQQLQESQNRKANYNKLRNFCDGTAGRAKTRLEEFYDSLEGLYKKHVVEFENTDDDYRKKAAQVYDACTSAEERRWDVVVKTAKFLNDINEGANAAVYDFVSGILGLAVMLAKIDLALRVAVVTVPFGTTPQWVKDTGKEAIEGVFGIAQILKNPGRTLAALGQKATDAVEEKGIPYVVSYAVTDLAIGRLVDMGIGKLRGLDKADDLSKISTKIDDVVDVADDVADVTKAVNKIDDVADAAKAVEKIDDVADAAKAVDKLDDAADVVKTVDKVDDVAGVKKTIETVQYGDHYDKIGRKKVLKPDVEYVDPNNYKYVTDSSGRISKVKGELQLKKGVRNEYAQRIVGGTDRLPIDDGGHLIGTQFNGSGQIDNLVPQSSKINRAGGEWYKMEQSWADALNRGSKVEVDIESIYSGISTRPDQFIVKYKVDGKATTKIILNQ